MRVWLGITAIVAGTFLSARGQQAPPASPLPAAHTEAKAGAGGGTTAPLTDEDKANALSDQVGKLMVKCVNLLTAQDPVSLDYCKQQRDLAEQYPPKMRMVDKMLAHDEYGIALAAFDHKNEALAEFDQEVALVPKAVKPGSAEWSTAYWHRAMIYTQMGAEAKADRDFRAAEENYRKAEKAQGAAHADKKMRAILQQHAALLQRQGKTAEAQRLLAEASR